VAVDQRDAFNETVGTGRGSMRPASARHGVSKGGGDGPGFNFGGESETRRDETERTFRGWMGDAILQGGMLPTAVCSVQESRWDDTPGVAAGWHLEITKREGSILAPVFSED
jgi:hypothetical protein